MCVKSASASGSEGGFAFDCGCGDLGLLRPAAAGWLSASPFAFCSFASFFARELFFFFGFAFAVVAASGTGVAVLLSLFVGETLSPLSVTGFSFPIASSLPFAFAFPFPSSSRFSSTDSAVFSSSCPPTFCGAGDESCKKISALLETCFFFPYTLDGFFDGRWVSIVSGVVNPSAVAFFVAWDLGGGVQEVGWIEGVRGCRGNGFARYSGNINLGVQLVPSQPRYENTYASLNRATNIITSTMSKDGAVIIMV